MKKFLKIFSIVIVVLLAVLLILPYAFRGKITELAKEEINSSINAKVDFSTINLGLIRSFPNFSVRVKDISILGNEPFENDTLLFAKNIELRLNIMSVFKGSPYEIKKILIDEPYIQLIALEDGKKNWEITLGKEEIAPEPAADEAEPFDISIGLRSFQIKNAKFVYDDQSMPFQLDVDKLNSELSGNFGLDQTKLQLALEVSDISSRFNKMTVAKNIGLKLKTDVDANLAEGIYTIITENLSLNELKTTMNGRFALEDSGVDIDFNFSAPNGSFKQLLSLIPPEFMKDYAGLNADGSLDFAASVKGYYSEDSFPAFNAALNVQNGLISYPDLPDKIESVQLALNVDNKTGDFDDTSVDLNPLSFSMKGNPLRLTATIKTPVSDPQIDTKMVGKLVLENLASFLPEDVIKNLQGEIDMDFALNTRMSAIEEEKYDQIAASGAVMLSRFSTELEDWDEPITIESADLRFNPRAVETEIKTLKLGHSDFNFNGQITDYLGYILSDGTLKGRFNLASNTIDTDELMEHFASDEESNLDLSLLPENMDVQFDASANTITFQQFVLEDVKMGVTYADKKISFNPLRADLLGGQMNMSGSLDAIDAKSPLIDLNFGISNFDIPTTYTTVGLFQAAAPIAKNAKGSFSTDFNLKGKLGEDLSPVFNSLQGGGGLSSSKLQIDSVPAMNQLASLLGNDDYKQLVTDAVNLNFEFVNGRVHQKPFSLGYAGTDMTMSGSLGLDQSLDYSLIFKIPYGKLGKNISDGIAGLANQLGAGKLNSGTEVQVKALISGNVTSPKISLDYKDYAKDLKNELAQVAQNKLNEEKAALEAKAKAEAEKLIAEARKQGEKLLEQADAAAQTIREEASKAAKLLRENADKEADKLVAEGEAKGALAGRLAQEAAKKLRSEADKKADDLENEADKKASLLQNEAQSKADNLVREAERKAGM